MTAQKAEAVMNVSRNLDRRSALASIAAFAAAGAGLARADSYPDRRITMVIPFPAGGPHDVIARPLAQALGANLGQPVIVENRAGGAGGMLGTREVARATPDGYTIMLGSVSTLAVAPALYKDPGYDPRASFAPVALVSSEPTCLVAAPHVTATTLAEVVAYAKAHPGKLNYGAATGTLAQLAGDLFKLATGADIVFVPYKGGAAGLTDVLGGQVDLFFTATSIVTPFIQAGKLKPIAVMGEERVPQLADIPTMRESGFDVVGYFWTGVLAPAGTPGAVVARLNGEINKALATPELRNAILKLSAQPKGGTPDDLAALIAAEVKKWPAVAKAAGTSVY
jgi:tripartite-type tricarboxylate transporter receptor subunit TctC